MDQVYSTAELVKKYGDKTQKANYKRYGKLMPNIRNAILRRVEQDFESVVPFKVGREIFYRCSGKLIEKAPRKDNRSKNGQGQLVGEFELNSLVINYLYRNDNNIRPMSATMWLRELGIIEEKLYRANNGEKGKHLEKLQKQFGKNIKDYNKADNDIEMLDDFLQVSTKSLKAGLISVFSKLAKAEVIIHQIEIWGCTTQNKHRKLKQKEIDEIDSIRSILLAKHGLKSNELFKTKMKEVKSYNREYKKELQNQLGLQYSYKAHLCVIQDSDLEVRDYLESIRVKGVLDFEIGLTDEFVFTMTQDYKDKYTDHSLELAKEREKNLNNISDANRVKSLKIMKHYKPIWELLLRHYLNNSIKSTPPAVETQEHETEGIIGVERINQHANVPRDSVLENLEHIAVSISDNPIDTSKNFNAEGYHEYQAAMEDIRDEINEYKDKYGDEAMQHIAVNSLVRQLTKKGTAEDMVAKLTSQRHFEKEEWDGLFEGGQPVKWEQTTNDPLEVFKRIRKK